MLGVGCEVVAEVVVAFAAVAADIQTCFGFVAVGLFRGRLCGEFLVYVGQACLRPIVACQRLL